MDRPTCRTCPYWGELDVDEDDDWLGECHRHPPSFPKTETQQEESLGVDKAYGMFSGWFPVVTCGDWCGEHPDFPAYLASR